MIIPVIKKFAFVFVSLVICVNAFATDSTLIEMIKYKRFPALQKMMHDKMVAKKYRTTVDAVLLNARNAPSESELLLARSKQRNDVDAWGKIWWETHIDNMIKQHQYGSVYAAQAMFLRKFDSHLTSKERKSISNSQILWNALADQSAQKVSIVDSDTIAMRRDIAGLWNIDVQAGSSQNFVFDTGAGYSVVSSSIADELGVDILPHSEFDVDAGITGNKIKARVGILLKMKLSEKIVFSNVVFLIFPDEALSFAEGRYVIKGILGLPVIAALKSIVIQENSVIVGPGGKKRDIEPNLYLDNTKPVIFLRIGKESELVPFTFDTGADRTILNSIFFDRFKTYYPWHEAKPIEVGGAGGTRLIEIAMFDSLEVNVSGDTVTMSQVQCSKEELVVNEDLYFGNIGKDLIGRFREIHIDFQRSAIWFEGKK